MEYQGVIAYSTARNEGEQAGDEKQAMISVLLEIAPQFDDQGILENPNVRRMMKKQARAMADEMFRSKHPNATIEDESDDENRQWLQSLASQSGSLPTKPEAQFFGGPYDGLKLNVDQISKLCNITPVATRHGVRLFILIPPLGDWDRLVNGEATKDEPFALLYPYERRFIPGGAEFHFCAEGEIYQAMADR